MFGSISNGSGQVMAVVYSKLTQVLAAFRGTSSFEETVQTFGNQNAQYVNFLPAPMPAGVVLQGAYNGHIALRQSFRQALSQLGGLATSSLVLTGHDAGGWLALMAATDLMQGTGGTPALPALSTPPQVYTIGTWPWATYRLPISSLAKPRRPHIKSRGRPTSSRVFSFRATS